MVIEYLSGSNFYVQTPVGLLDGLESTGSQSEAEIFSGFLETLNELKPGMVFNVPKGVIEEMSALEVLSKFGEQSNAKVRSYLSEKGMSTYPLFVIDPFDRNNMPSVESGLWLNSDCMIKLMQKVKASLFKIKVGINLL